jgi:hypothetical protein
MEKTIETNARPDVQDEITLLGVASVETKGVPPIGPEGQGLGAGVGITE